MAPPIDAAATSTTTTTPSIQMRFTFDTFVILVIMLAIIISNVIILLVLFKTDALKQINKYFFCSLTVADLLIGVFVTPFSFWASLFDHWIYGDQFCHIEAYVAAIFWIASVGSLTWISIDHYVAIRKPGRYETLITPMRSYCWIAFLWIGALSFCCPPLMGVARARYYREAYICIIDWKLQKAYFITAGILVIVPPIIALGISNLYIFTNAYKKKRLIYEKSMLPDDSSNRPDSYFLSFLTGIVFIGAWLPWSLLQIQELIAKETKNPKVHFYFLWFAVANSFWKFITYTIFGQDFRQGLKDLFSRIKCKCCF